MNRSAALLATAAMCLALSTCMFYKTEVGVVDKDAAPELKDFSVKSPTKLHLRDGSVVLYDKGFEVIGKNIVGEGERYDLTRSTKTTVAGVSTDEVAYLEYYDRKNRRTLSTLASAAAATTGVVGGVLLAKALFGSCPTVYAESGQDRQLQAELFSHSISPGFEMQDLDRLQGIRQIGNSVSLLVANEALETHYINRANLLVVDHLPGYEALPAGDGEVLLLGGAAQLLDARSRSGVDVRELIAHRDDSAYQSGAELLSAFVERAEPDWIDLSIAVPAAARHMYVMVRVRNTLLATVFLYDVAMAQQGFYAIDWMATDSAEPAYAARFAQWFNRGFGLSIERLDDGVYRQVGLLAPTGPIAWKQAAHPVAVAGPAHARLRLSFTPDNWAIDWVGVSFVSTAAVQQHSIAPRAIDAVRGNGYSDRPGLLAKADNDYLVTYPGDVYRLSFEVPPVKDGLQRSYFLASRGYYVEWMRMNWIAGGPGAVTGMPMEFDDALLQRTARLWLEKRQDMQVRFYETRLPLDGDWR